MCFIYFSAYQQGVDMNLGDYDGRTALHLAAAEGHVRCVKFLLEVGKVKHDQKDRWGQTPLSEAILFKHTKIASILKRHDRAKSMQNSKVGNKGKDVNDQGEALWRKLVERKIMTPEEKRKKIPVFKV
jgi:ankyrin repeat protein